MIMKLHHQKYRKFADGFSVKVGEDACPYADDELLIVADGLGGRGGYPHSQIDPDVLNREVFYKKFIEPVVGVANEGYANAVTNSFSELFELKDRYFTSSSTMRTSGYFASRLVTAIVLYELKFNPDLSRQRIFESLLNGSDEEKTQYLDYVRTTLANAIYSKLSDIAARMGLTLQSRTKGSYLLPTTLTVALINQSDNGLDILYIWAGDSRGYIWNADGLAQITDDHECDETMTNLISLSSPFQLEARLVSLDKPALVFNATDGCYKCPCFASAFDLEYVFLQAISGADDFNMVSQNLDAQFNEIGTHDDSNTIALASFGFESFAEIKSAVEKRIEYLQENIVVNLPDILECDYVEELARLDVEMDNSVYSVKDALIKIEPIIDFVKGEIEHMRYVPYMRDVALRNRKLEEIDKDDARNRANILEWVQKHWLSGPCLKKHFGVKAVQDDFYANLTEIETICAQEKERYAEKYSNVIDAVNEHVLAVLTMREEIVDLSAMEDKTFQTQLSCNLNALADALSTLSNGIVKGKNNRYFSRYFKCRAELSKLTSRYIEQDKEAIENLVQQIAESSIALTDIDIPTESRIELESYISALNGNKATRQSIQNEIDDLPNKHLIDFWNNDVCCLISIIRREHSELIPEDIKERISENVGELQEKYDEMKRRLELRDQLYDKYNETYYRFFKESAL